MDEHEITVVAPPTPQSPHPDSLTSVTALARFEFEPGRANDGTKVMMVEWQDDDQTRDTRGAWHVSWIGKKTVFPADDHPTDNIRRLYFLLSPGASIPPHITIAYHPPGNPSEDEILKMSVNPLPAIFTPELGATAKASGRKGVLHTIWAKKRLQVLEKEIQRELDHNLEGIALEMALAEKKWIEENFGLPARKPLTLDLRDIQNAATSPPHSPALQSPKSPGGRRLTDKLKGLSISTEERAVRGPATGRAATAASPDANPLSPQSGDMAYSSFSSFRGERPVMQQQKSADIIPAKKFVSAAPPAFIRQQQTDGANLDFFAAAAQASVPAARPNTADEDGNDLFAVAMSPRAPDDPKSPFSMPSMEAGAFAKIKGTRT